MMNKDEIQLTSARFASNSCCGLVMNKDEIQLLRSRGLPFNGCGLVMNKDEIQHLSVGSLDLLAVVWR